jgi:small subunit ribosomal protein S20
MPNSKQAAKRLRQDERRRLANKATRSAMRTAMKRVLKAETPEQRAELLPAAVQRIDKAAKKRVLHPNAAARIKSRLAKRLAAAAAAN